MRVGKREEEEKNANERKTNYSSTRAEFTEIFVPME